MALTEGWKLRLERWQKALTDRIYFPPEPEEMAGFVLYTSLVLTV